MTAWLSIFTLNWSKMTQTGAGAEESSIAGEGAEFKRAMVLAGGTGQSARHEGHLRRWPHGDGEG